MRTLSSKPVKKRAMQAADAELLNADFAIHDHLLHTMVSEHASPGAAGKKEPCSSTIGARDLRPIMSKV